MESTFNRETAEEIERKKEVHGVIEEKTYPKQTKPDRAQAIPNNHNQRKTGLSQKHRKPQKREVCPLTRTTQSQYRR